MPVDTSMYGQQQSPMDSMLKIMQLKKAKDKKNQDQQNANNASTQGSATPYGSGVNMQALGAGQPYGGQPTTLTNSDMPMTPIPSPAPTDPSTT